MKRKMGLIKVAERTLNGLTTFCIASENVPEAEEKMYRRMEAKCAKAINALETRIVSVYGLKRYHKLQHGDCAFWVLVAFSVLPRRLLKRSNSSLKFRNTCGTIP